MFPTIFLFLGEWWQREQLMKQGCFQKGWPKSGEERRGSVLAAAGEMVDHSHITLPWPGT